MVIKKNGKRRVKYEQKNSYFIFNNTDMFYCNFRNIFFVKST